MPSIVGTSNDEAAARRLNRMEQDDLEDEEEEEMMVPSLPMPEARLRFSVDPRKYKVEVLPKALSCR